MFVHPGRVVIIVLHVYLHLVATQNESAEVTCPPGHFPCGNLSVCLEQRYQCDSNLDCDNGADELECYDKSGSLKVVDFKAVNEWDKFYLECDLPEYPAACICSHWNWLHCKEVGWTSVPRNISSNVTVLILANNSISKINPDDFENYPDVRLLHLEGNHLLSLQPETFSKLRSLLKLFLSFNSLKTLELKTFSGLNSLRWLSLQYNVLENLDLDVFEGLVDLEWLDLNGNHLHLRNTRFPALHNLSWLNLHYNMIEEIHEDTFSNLIALKVLNLQFNRIHYIHEEAFKNLINLIELNLTANFLKQLHPISFRSLGNLEKLAIGYNPISFISEDLFYPLKNLQSLNLEDLEISNINLSLFINLRELGHIYFKKFFYCSFVPHVRVCKPNTDGVSSTENLLGRPILRISVWLVAFLTCLGNTIVLCGRMIAREDNKVLSMFIRNLAAADMLMGIYLFVIGGHDLVYRDQYNFHAHSWMSSWRCTMSGTLAMTSSEASVLILAYMSLERFFCIVCPFGSHRLGTHTALSCLVTIWVISCVLALIPVLNWQHSNAFYGSNGMCFPLHIDEPYLLGWQYSAFVFLGINGLGVTIIAVVYLAMFVSIQQTRRATPLMVGDTEFAFRFFFIVLTDCMCWIPIIVIKVAALRQTDISADLYAWLVVFILPINSAINPFLYTFTTSKFRSRIQKTVNAFLRCRWTAYIHRKDSSDTDTTSASSKKSLHKTNSVCREMPSVDFSTNYMCAAISNMYNGKLVIPHRNGTIKYLESIESCI